MRPPQAFTFDGYTVRPLSEKDRPYLEVQIRADQYHQGRMERIISSSCSPERMRGH